jgi:hypothetical protein
MGRPVLCKFPSLTYPGPLRNNLMGRPRPVNGSVLARAGYKKIENRTYQLMVCSHSPRSHPWHALTRPNPLFRPDKVNPWNPDSILALTQTRPMLPGPHALHGGTMGWRFGAALHLRFFEIAKNKIRPTPPIMTHPDHPLAHPSWPVRILFAGIQTGSDRNFLVLNRSNLSCPTLKPRSSITGRGFVRTAPPHNVF